MDALSLIISVCTGISGVATGIAVGAWYASAKSSKIDQNTEAIKQINSRCEVQRKELLNDLERSICAGIKLAIKDIEAQRLQQRATDREEMASLRSMVNQHDADIRDIFYKIDDLRAKK